MFCTNCGKKLEDGEKFCDQCGERVEENIASSNEFGIPVFDPNAEQTKEIQEEQNQSKEAWTEQNQTEQIQSEQIQPEQNQAEQIQQQAQQQPKASEEGYREVNTLPPINNAAPNFNQGMNVNNNLNQKKSSGTKVLVIVLIIGALLLLCCVGSCIAGVFYIVNGGGSYQYLGQLYEDHENPDSDYTISDEEFQRMLDELEKNNSSDILAGSENAAMSEAVEESVEESLEAQYEGTEDLDDIMDMYFIFPDSSTEYLEFDDFIGLNKDLLRIARNEIYARHGRKFKDAAIQAYFDNMPWYTGYIEPDDFKDDFLNPIEKRNLEMIVDMEKRIKE